MDYKKARKELEIPMYEGNNMPEGVWVTVSEASRLLKKSKMGIRAMILTKRIDVCRIKGKSRILHVNINSAKRSEHERISSDTKRKVHKSWE